MSEGTIKTEQSLPPKVGCRFVVATRDIELEGSWGRGDQIYEGLWLTNEIEPCRKLLTKPFRDGIGQLELHHLETSGALIYGSRDDAPLASVKDALALLTSYLYVVVGFLDALWLIKDHAVNIEVGFLGVGWNANVETTHSNLIGYMSTLADGGIRITRFSRDEIRLAKVLWKRKFIPSCPPEAFRDSNPFLERDRASLLVSRREHGRFQRFMYYVSSARGKADLGFKVGVFCSALEVLFSTDSSELTHKIAERTACFLSTTFEERKSLFQTVKKAYTARSKVIHGDTLSEQQSKDVQFLSKAMDDILRQAARRIADSDLLTRALESKKEEWESFLISLCLHGARQGLLEELATEIWPNASLENPNSGVKE